MTSFVACATALLLMPGLAAQLFEDDFDAAPPLDASWAQYDLRMAGFPGSVVSYTFPDDGAGGKAYRMEVLVPPIPDAGPPRALSYPGQTYTRFRVGVDILDWNVDSDIVLGVAARVSDVGLASTGGYLFNLNPIDQDMDITRVLMEQPTELSDANAPVVPDRGPYRLEFLGSADALVGHVYRLIDARAPVMSTAVIDDAYSSGWSGMLIFDNNEGSWPWTGVTVLHDNYVSDALSATTSPQIVLLQPGHLTTATTNPAPVRVSLFDIIDVVNVVPGSVRLEIDGVQVPNSALTETSRVELNDGPTDLPGLTISYQPPAAPLVSGGWHTNAVSFQDTEGAVVRQEWVFRYPVLSPGHAAAPGSGRDPGFDVRVVQTSSTPVQEKSLWRAERQLAHPPLLAIDLETNTTIGVINYTQQTVPNDTPDGYFADEATFPGINPAGATDFIALEALFYLELPTGTHRLGVRCDDGFQLRSGASPQDPEALVLVESTKNTFDGTVDVEVEEAGVYPFRLVWFEHGGDAHLELYAQDIETSERQLINSPTSAIKAYRTVAIPVVLEFAAALVDAFEADPEAVVDTQARRITTFVDGAARYYRLRGDAAAKLEVLTAEGGQLVLSY